MDFSLSSEQAMLVETVRQFVNNELRPLEEGVERSGSLAADDARRIFDKSRTLGLYAMNIPSEFGGGGLSMVDWMLVEEQFGHTSDILVRRAFGNVYEILLEGTDEQRQRWLIPSVKGERTFSLAF
ncbi:MAG TPA: acyl-CoA dehydrogenase family protein, partial [Afifellaceae bacterium]|nr:acyl-CoA dehydrogenase family protein [Afifellaceae bacterium]